MAKSVVDVVIKGDAKDAIRAFHETENAAKGMGSKVKAAGLLVAGGLVAGTAAVGAFGVSAVKAALKGEQAHAQLAQAIKNSGRSYQQFAPQIENATQQLANFGFENDDVENALSTLIQGSGNTSKSIANIGLAANIAKARHLDLASAAQLVTKVMSGNTTVLKRMGITYPGVAGGAQNFQKAQVGVLQATIALNKVQDAVRSGHLKGKAATDALALAHDKLNAAIDKANKTEHAAGDAIKFLSDRFKGDAQASAQTLQGRIDSLKAHFANWKEEIGNRLIPILSRLADWLAKNLPVAFAAVEGWIKAHWPGIREVLVRTWSTYVAYWNAVVVPAFRRVVEVLQQVVNWVRANWPAIRAIIISAFGTVEAWVKTHWPQIQQAIESTIEHIKVAIRNAVGFIEAVWRNFHNQILLVVKTQWDHMKAMVQSAILLIQGIINVITGLIRGNWSQVWKGITQIFRGEWLNMRSIVAAALGIMRAVISAALHALGTLFSGTWATIKSTTAQWWANIKTAVAQGVLNVVAAIAKLPGMALRALSGAGDALVRVGSDMVHGIARGISNAAGAVAAAIHSIGFHYGGSHITVLGKTVTLVPAFDFHLAKGTPFLPYSGLALVGEQGPEAVALPRGARVYPASDTRRMMNGGGDGRVLSSGNTYNINIMVGPAADQGRIGQELVTAIKAYERRNGSGWRAA